MRLAWKKYWNCVLEDLQQEQCAIEAYLKKRTKEAGKVEKLLEDKGCMELLGEEFQPINEKLAAWMQEEYIRNHSIHSLDYHL